MTELLDEMKEAGCQSLFIGFESINSKSIESVHKVQNSVSRYEKLVDEIHKRGIMINDTISWHKATRIIARGK